MRIDEIHISDETGRQGLGEGSRSSHARLTTRPPRPRAPALRARPPTRATAPHQSVPLFAAMSNRHPSALAHGPESSALGRRRRLGQTLVERRNPLAQLGQRVLHVLAAREALLGERERGFLGFAARASLTARDDRAGVDVVDAADEFIPRAKGNDAHQAIVELFLSLLDFFFALAAHVSTP